MNMSQLPKPKEPCLAWDMLIKTKVSRNSHTKKSNIIAWFYHIVTKMEGGPQPSSKLRLCLEPLQTSSALSILSLRRLADIQWPASLMHPSSWQTTQSMSPGKQLYVISERMEVHLTFFNTVSKVSRVHNEKRGPKTEPCGSEQSRWTTKEPLLPRTTVKVLSDRYELKHWKTTTRRPHWRSRPSEGRGQWYRMPPSNQASTEWRPGHYWLQEAGHCKPSAPQSQYCETDGRLTEMLAVCHCRQWMPSV